MINGRGYDQVITADKVVLTSDWHLRHTIPPCFIDYWKANKEAQQIPMKEAWINYQFEVVTKIFTIAFENRAHILMAGDIFHKAIVEPVIVYRLNELIKEFEQLGVLFYYRLGNHDVSYERYDDVTNTSSVLLLGNQVTKGVFGLHSDTNGVTRRALLLHELVVKDEHHFLVKVAKDVSTASDIFDIHADCELILIGDNHEHFTSEFYEHGVGMIGKSVLVNSGSITQQMRMNSQHDYKIVVYDVCTAAYEGCTVSQNYCTTTEEKSLSGSEEGARSIDIFKDSLGLLSLEKFDLTSFIERHKQELTTFQVDTLVSIQEELRK